VVAVPVVNVFGFVAESRYLPDRRDLNRSFPGSKGGSLASRLARLFMDEILRPSDVGIDFHAGSDDRTNLAHIRGDLADEETRRLALSFGAPVLLDSKPIQGSLRAAALKEGKQVLVFEGGEPRRFSRRAVETGVPGTLRVLGALGMIDDVPVAPLTPPLQSKHTKWVRAPRSGILRLEVQLGQRVERGDRLGIITDPAVREGKVVRASMSGIVLGHTVSPVVHLGDGLVHLAGAD
jgi:predicted deacylase